MKKTTPTPLPPLTRSARIHNHPRITRLLLVLPSNPPLILLAALFRAHLAIFPVIKYSLSTIFTVNRLDGSSTVSNPSFWRWSDVRVCVWSNGKKGDEKDARWLVGWARDGVIIIFYLSKTHERGIRVVFDLTMIVLNARWRVAEFSMEKVCVGMGYPIDRANNKFLKNLCVCSFRFELWLIYLLNRGTNYHRFRNVSVINPNLPAVALHRSSWIEESFVKLSKETTIDSRDKKFHEYLHLTFDLYADTEGQLFFLSSFLFSLLFENFVKETLDFLVKVKNYDRLDEPTSGWKRRYDRYKIVR